MKYIAIISFLILCSSCQLNSQNKGLEVFKNELSTAAIDKWESTIPYSFSDKIAADYNYYFHYEKFGNSGICVQFNIPKEDEKEFLEKLKRYKHLEKNAIAYNDTAYVYVYKTDTTIKLPELTAELGEFSSARLDGDSKVDA